MKNRIAYGASTRSGSHIAPGARCNNVIQLARRYPLPPSPSVAWSRAQETTMHSFRTSPQRGANSSALLREELRSQGLAAEKMTSHLFSSRSALKLFQFADAVFEVSKAFLLFLMCLFGGAVITGSVLCWLFIF